MKKPFILSVIALTGIALAGSAQALSMVQPTTLLVESVTQTEAVVNAVIGYDDFRNAVQNRYPIKVSYTACIGGPTVLCPTSNEQVFPYIGSSDTSNLRMMLSNLQAGTKYYVRLGYEVPVTCVTLPCNPLKQWQSQTYTFTTLPGNQFTQPRFSSIGSTSAITSLSFGNDMFWNAATQRQTISIKYQARGSSSEYVKTFAYDTTTNLMPLTLTGLQPSTEYLVWIGYSSPQMCTMIYPSQCPPATQTWTGPWLLTTSAGTVVQPSGILTERLIRGMKSSQVALLQQILSSKGYLSGTIDGSFGPKTEAAVRLFQAAYGLSVDGRVGPNTRAVLNQMVTI